MRSVEESKMTTGGERRGWMGETVAVVAARRTLHEGLAKNVRAFTAVRYKLRRIVTGVEIVA